MATDSKPRKAAQPKRQTCTKCNQSKPIDQYARKSAKRGGGPIRVCRLCIAQQSRERRQAAKVTPKARTGAKKTSAKKLAAVA